MKIAENDINGDYSIQVKNLSKKYILSKGIYRSPPGDNEAKEFLALDDVSFELKKGEIVGIIGENGSGKSTLLKILSSVLRPSAGTVTIKGRVSSILDLGSNFHPDLTGSENVTMQLRIKEYSKSDIKKLLNQINEFSGVGKYFEQPVKYYSNGMFLRLAFAVAFNTFCDILLLDEVLSVGDEEFRLKSTNFIRQLSESGKTILLVSHNRSEIIDLCSRCIWLEKGKIKEMGSPLQLESRYFHESYEKYEKELTAQAEEGTEDTSLMASPVIDLTTLAKHEGPLGGNEFLSVKEFSLSGDEFDETTFYNHHELIIRMVIEKKTASTILPGIIILDLLNRPVLTAGVLLNQDNKDYLNAYRNETGEFEIECKIPGRLLAEGTYLMLLRFGRDAVYGDINTPEAYSYPKRIRFNLKNDPNGFDFLGDNNFVGSVRPYLPWMYAKIKQTEPNR